MSFLSGEKKLQKDAKKQKLFSLNVYMYACVCLDVYVSVYIDINN